jgi:hypothetical protein
MTSGSETALLRFNELPYFSKGSPVARWEVRVLAVWLTQLVEKSDSRPSHPIHPGRIDRLVLAD